MKPLITSIEKNDSLKVYVLNIDIDIDKEVAAEFEIDALPVFMFYRNGCREWVSVGIILTNGIYNIQLITF